MPNPDAAPLAPHHLAGQPDRRAGADRRLAHHEAGLGRERDLHLLVPLREREVRVVEDVEEGQISRAEAIGRRLLLDGDADGRRPALADPVGCGDHLVDRRELRSARVRELRGEVGIALEPVPEVLADGGPALLQSADAVPQDRVVGHVRLRRVHISARPRGEQLGHDLDAGAIGLVERAHGSPR